MAKVDPFSGIRPPIELVEKYDDGTPITVGGQPITLRKPEIYDLYLAADITAKLIATYAGPKPDTLPLVGGRPLQFSRTMANEVSRIFTLQVCDEEDYDENGMPLYEKSAYKPEEWFGLFITHGEEYSKIANLVDSLFTKMMEVASAVKEGKAGDPDVVNFIKE